MHDTNTVKSRTLTRRCAPPSPARGSGAAKRDVCRGDVPDDSRSSVLGETAPINGRSPQTNRLARVAATRPEEHTSDLQSPLRSSYALACVQHKTTRKEN